MTEFYEVRWLVHQKTQKGFRKGTRSPSKFIANSSDVLICLHANASVRCKKGEPFVRRGRAKLGVSLLGTTEGEEYGA